MGLLNRARTLDDGTVNRTAEDPTDTAEKILRHFPYTTDHVDYPGGVYYAYKELIEFPRGSLLLPNRLAGVYYPWIATGFDRTTTRRLRIPIDFPPLLIGKPGYMNPLCSEDMEPMFSNREYGRISDLTLSVLGQPGIPSALLLTADCGWNNGIPEEFQTAAKLMNETLGSGIEHSRRLTVEPDGEEFEDLNGWLGNWGDRKGILAVFSLKHMIDLYLGAVAGVELFYAREDSVNLVRRITGRMGRLYNLNDDRILIMFPPERLPDPNLFLHQLAVSVKSAFLKISEPPVFQAEFRQWPEERAVVEELLSGFF